MLSDGGDGFVGALSRFDLARVELVKATISGKREWIDRAESSLKKSRVEMRVLGLVEFPAKSRAAYDEEFGGALATPKSRAAYDEEFGGALATPKSRAAYDEEFGGLAGAAGGGLDD